MTVRAKARSWLFDLRQQDRAQFYIVAGALVFLLTVIAGNVYAQTQEAINATFSERMSGIYYRLDRLENYMNAAIAALIANIVAHLVQIQAQRANRRDRS